MSSVNIEHHPALKPLWEFVQNIEEVVSSSDVGISATSTLKIMSQFEILREIIELELKSGPGGHVNTEILNEMEIIKGRLEAILSIAEDKYDLHLKAIECEHLRELLRFTILLVIMLAGLIGGIKLIFG